MKLEDVIEKQEELTEIYKAAMGALFVEAEKADHDGSYEDDLLFGEVEVNHQAALKAHALIVNSEVW